MRLWKLSKRARCYSRERSRERSMRFTFSASGRPEMEGTVNKRIHERVAHAEKKNRRLQLFTQLSTSQPTTWQLSVENVTLKTLRYLVVGIQKNKSYHHEVVRCPAHDESRHDYYRDAPVRETWSIKRTAASEGSQNVQRFHFGALEYVVPSPREAGATDRWIHRPGVSLAQADVGRPALHRGVRSAH